MLAETSIVSRNSETNLVEHQSQLRLPESSQPPDSEYVLRFRATELCSLPGSSSVPVRVIELAVVLTWKEIAGPFYQTVHSTSEVLEESPVQR